MRPPPAPITRPSSRPVYNPLVSPEGFPSFFFLIHHADEFSRAAVVMEGGGALISYPTPPLCNPPDGTEMFMAGHHRHQQLGKKKSKEMREEHTRILSLKASERGGCKYWTTRRSSYEASRGQLLNWVRRTGRTVAGFSNQSRARRRREFTRRVDTLVDPGRRRGRVIRASSCPGELD